MEIGISALNEKILMLNAEHLGRIERSLIGKKHPIKQLTPLPSKVAMERALPSDSSTLLTKAVLLRDGCVSVKNVISEEVADELLIFINEEKTRSEAEVNAGVSKYDDLFGAVNNRYSKLNRFPIFSHNFSANTIPDETVLICFCHTVNQLWKRHCDRQ